MYWYFQHIQAHHNKSWICATIDDKTFFNAQQGLTYIHTHGDVCSVMSQPEDAVESKINTEQFEQ